MKHLIGLVLTARGEKKWIWGDEIYSIAACPIVLSVC